MVTANHQNKLLIMLFMRYQAQMYNPCLVEVSGLLVRRKGENSIEV